MAKFLNSTGLSYFKGKIITLLSNKVDKVNGKGLSTNDFTDDAKSKLDGIAANANNYSLPKASKTVLGGVKVGTNLSIADGVLSAKNTEYGTASGSAPGLMSAADKAKLDAFSSASAYALKTDIASMYKYKGSVATYDKLPTTGNTVGDVWNVESNEMNYAWTGSAWDSLGGIFSIDAITNTEIDNMFA